VQSKTVEPEEMAYACVALHDTGMSTNLLRALKHDNSPQSMARRQPFLISLLISLAAIASASAQTDAPTDRDLQAGYCVGVGNIQLQALQGADPITAVARSTIQARRQHYMKYLSARGYIGDSASRSHLLVPAIAQGEEDGQEFMSVGDLCANRCTPQDQSKVDIAAVSQCFRNCKAQRMTEAKSNRITACQTFERELPF
jgi:hypothetical protein